MWNKEIQKILSKMRKAIEDYDMIKEGDKIAVALSGGKDSVTLLYGLKALQIFYPKHFEIIALTIHPGFEKFDTKILENICNEINVELVVVPGYIKEIVFEERKEKNPCSLCANLRRGMLNSIAKEYNCNKIALGHNEDDVLETFLMNMIYAGNLSTFAPVSYMDRSDMTVIRPLIYTPEKSTRNFIRKSEIHIMPKVCPMDGESSREYALELLKELEQKNKHIRANLMGAIKRANINGWKESKS